MYLTTSDFIAMFIAGSAVSFLTIMLLIANTTLKEQNRYLKQRLRDQQKECTLTHAKVPF